jgi:hypothetical protein
MFKLEKDQNGTLCLWRKVRAAHPGAMDCWELIASEREFPDLLSAFQNQDQ